MSYKITIINSENETLTTIVVSEDFSILDHILKARLKMDYVCGGHGTCGTCKFLLIEGQVSVRNEIEQEMFEERGMKKSERLSCQNKPLSDLTIKVLSIKK